METSFQRSLFEYDDFMVQISSPTLVCRRTGEVAAVNKEFTALTGWTQDVLLGLAPNLNVNTGGGGSATTSGRAGLSTPRLRGLNNPPDDSAVRATAAATDGTPRPVFVAELLDDDSVIDFYEDYAQLAFGDSRGHVTRKGRLLKYRVEQSLEGAAASAAAAGGNPEVVGAPPVRRDAKRSSILSSRVTRIDGEHGISRFAKDGKLECSYTWIIKRDTFDIPMMIVMNVSLPFFPVAFTDHGYLIKFGVAVPTLLLPESRTASVSGVRHAEEP
jgi:hypothetical protein